MLFSVFVGNLSWSTTNEQLMEFAQRTSNVVSVEVKRHEDTLRSKGWGLIVFSDLVSAEAAVAALNLTPLNDRDVHVRLDRAQPDKGDITFNVFVGNLPWTLQSSELMNAFTSFNPSDCQILTNMYGKSRGFAIVKFNNEVDATRAIEAMNSFEMGGRKLECRFDRGPGRSEDSAAAATKTSVFVGKLDLNVDDDALAALFARFGPIATAKINRYPDGKSKAWGIVKFDSPEDAKTAVDSMNGVPVGPVGSAPLKVRFDRK